MADVEGLHPAVRAAWARLLADAEAKRLGLFIVSAYRSPELQQALFNEAVQKYGSQTAARKWVAPPWRSNHGPVLKDDGTRVPLGPNQGGKWGVAVDVGAPNVAAARGIWPAKFRGEVDALAKRYGFASPMDWEDWHYEPVPGFDYSATHVPPAPVEDTMEKGMAVDVAFNPAKPAQIATLDRWGGIHSFGGAPAMVCEAAVNGWDMARRLIVTDWAKGTGYVLDLAGALHPVNGAARVDTAPAYWPNVTPDPVSP